uniref:LIM zinc-binding domain-containing protein n=1 Tax=Accipiter nisus TaxID=211598 RepID=A0A8B9M4V6_9AVES
RRRGCRRQRVKGLRGAGGVGLQGLRDARGARPRPGSPGGAVPRAAASSCGRGRTSGRGGAGRGGAGRRGSDSGGAGAEHPTAGASGEPSRADTMPKCPRCQKEVYFAEKVTSLGKDWHRPCLRCEKCNKTLTSGGHAEHDGKPYCNHPCYAALFGPKGFGRGGAESHTFK